MSVVKLPKWADAKDMRVDGSNNNGDRVKQPWEHCRDAHLAAVPRDLFDALTVDQRRKLTNFEGLILEVLPMSKRSDVELAVRNDLLKMTKIPGTNRNFVSEAGRDTIWGILFEAPQIRIKELFPDATMD